MFEEMDVNVEIYMRVDRLIQDILTCYKEIYYEMKKQTVQLKLDIFLKKSAPVPSPFSPSANEPIPSTSYINVSEKPETGDFVNIASFSSSFFSKN